MERKKSISDYIEKEKGRFMQKHAGKTISDLAAELGISMEKEANSVMKLIEERLSTKFVAELLENPRFQRHTILHSFSDGYGETFGLEFLGEEDFCRRYGMVEEHWYSLCISPESARFAYTNHITFEGRMDDFFEGCPITMAKPLLKNCDWLNQKAADHHKQTDRNISNQ